VVYRSPALGGLVLIREAEGYRTVVIEGAPTEFRTKASDLTGKTIDIFLGEAPLGFPESIVIVRDEHGQPALAIAKRENNFSLAILNVATAFKALAVGDVFSHQERTASCDCTESNNDAR
jgi:hypothetical protein